jgi:hypothetical protein
MGPADDFQSGLLRHQGSESIEKVVVLIHQQHPPARHDHLDSSLELVRTTGETARS